MNFGSATSGQLATMRNNNKPADSSSMSKHQCLQSQLSFESGLQVERLTGFTDEWSVSSARSKLVVPELVNVDVGNNNYRSRLCHEVEAFEGAATRVMGPEERDEFAGGHVQQDNSSATSPEQTEAAAAAALQHGDPGHTHSGKRKAAGKDLTISNTNSGKVSEGDEIHMNVKCPKSSHHSSKSKSADRSPTSEQTYSGGLSPKSLKASSKLQEPPHPKQDYIHVRARRGQATDSHSLAERVRREKISERMKFLQDLVPGCSKVTGKAVMLDEIINYVQSLQRQIEFLSMKLAAVDPQPDINLENLLNKELAVQARSPETTLMGPDPSAGLYREYQSHLQIQQQINTCNMDLRSVGTLCDAYLRSSMNYAPVQLEPLAFADHSFVDPVTQTLNGVVCDGDLQNIVHMGNTHAGRQDFFGQGRLHGGPGFLTPGFLKVEY